MVTAFFVYLLLPVGLPFTDLGDPLTAEKKEEVNSFALHIMVTRLSNLKAHSDHAIQDITPPFGDA